MRHESRSPVDSADMPEDDDVVTTEAAPDVAKAGIGSDRTRDPLLALCVGTLALTAGGALESALRPTHGGIDLLAGEVVLSCALTVTTYLWLRTRRVRTAVTAIERSRIETDKETRLAAAIQRHLLKSPATHPSAVAWHARLPPGRAMGGDFYDVVTQPNGSVLILSAQTSSHGISAAVTIASVLAAFRQLARRAPDLSTLASALSQAIHDDHLGSTYVTAVLCLVDPVKGALRYVNAGHPPGRLAGPGGLVRLEVTGPALGLVSHGHWETHSIVARAYTLGLLVTDGLAEALASEGDADQILDTLVNRLAGETPESACRSVMQRVRRAAQSSSAPADEGSVLAFAPARGRA